METETDILIIGGGAAGFFAAVVAAEASPKVKISILEQAAHPLGKVKISGGGRCNVTHQCADPERLITHYPRGGRELLGPFTRFGVTETLQWFENHGVKIKAEGDGRMFPVTDNSETIIQCLTTAAEKAGVKLHLKTAAEKLVPPGQDFSTWKVIAGDTAFAAKAVLVATGSSNRMWGQLAALRHTLVEPVPSLFTFHIADERLSGLPGLSVPDAIVTIPGTKFQQKGPLLITHWGTSGPAILKLSAWAARELHERQYHFRLRVNWTGAALSAFQSKVEEFRRNSAKKQVNTTPVENIPSRLWQRFTLAAGIPPSGNWADLTAKQMKLLAEQVCEGEFEVNGKSTFKEEFVTAGGVKLSEVDFRSMQSRVHAGLYFAGETLNVDAVTGGFNFQAAWTTGFIAANGMIRQLS